GGLVFTIIILIEKGKLFLHFSKKSFPFSILYK
ncbi:MAG: hypothetical protein ACI9RM_001875, partial [Ulvibacter sp.]